MGEVKEFIARYKRFIYREWWSAGNVTYLNIAKSGCTSIKAYIEEKEGYIVHGKSPFPAPWRFTVVRNPYQRITSCYVNKIIDGKGWLYRYYPFVNKNMSFEQFVKAICRLPWWLQERHFRCQYNIVYKGFKCQVDRVYQLENLKISPYLCDMTQHMNKSNTDYDQMLTPEIKEMIYKRYEKDFRYFGYKK